MTGRRALPRGGRLPARAQPAGRVFQLGWLRPNAAGPSEFQALGIPAALQRVGWVEGKNLLIERRWADGQAARLLTPARELVKQRCDALFPVGLTATLAAAEATAPTPIIFFGNFDSVATLDAALHALLKAKVEAIFTASSILLLRADEVIA